MATDLINIQNAILAQIIDDHNHLRKDLVDESLPSHTYIISLQKELQTIIKTATDNHTQILNTKKTSEALTKYHSDDVFKQIRRNFHAYWAQLEDINLSLQRNDPTFNTTSFQDTTMGVSRGSEIKLHPLSIPKFSGNIRKWKSYYNSFVSLVDENQNLTTVDKFRYLLDGLEGEAKGIIHHLDIDESNYDLAKELLKNRYEHKRLLVNVQINTIYNITAFETESAHNIRITIDTLRECYQSLKVLGIQVESWDPVIIFLTQCKLPLSTNQLWEEKLENSKELPTFKKFEEFLECRFRTFDSLKHRLNLNNPTMVHTQSDDNKCKICNQLHDVTNCQTFLNADATSRYHMVIENTLCINCLSRFHTVQNCNSRNICRNCGQKHHTFLHRNSNTLSNKAKYNNSYSNNSHCNKSNKFQSNSNFNKYSNSNQNKHNSKNNSKAFSYNNQNRINSNQSRQTKTTLLTTNPVEDQNITKPIETQNSEGQASSRSFHINSLSKNIYLLGTAVVQLNNHKGNVRTVRALLDPGSEDNYIIDSIANGLPLKKYYCPSTISVIGGQPVEGITHRCNFIIKSLHSDFVLEIDAGIKKSITQDLPSDLVPGLCYSFLNNLELADSSFDEPGQIHLLLGMGVWVKIVQPGLIKNDTLMAQKTTLGWLVQGVANHIPIGYKSKPSQCFVTQTLDTEIQKFWELENVVNSKKIETPENILCEQIFIDSVQQLKDKKLSVDLPFKNKTDPNLGDSMEIAKRRFINLEKRLSQNLKLKEEYHRTIKEYIDLGHMRKATNLDGKPDYYLPHHAVFKDNSTTTKVRVVFDQLLTGSKLQIDIRDILCKWRQYPIVFSADIEKMYRQFWINSHHQKYQKVLWRFSEKDPLKTYVLTTVTFGTSAAPFLALRLLKYIADSPIALNFPLASKIIHSDFYVDDLLSGAFSCIEAIQAQQQIRELLNSFGLSIRKWCSNEINALKSIPAEICEISEHSFDETDYKKTLGIYWSPSKDSFAFAVESQDFSKLKLTKRKTLSLIARLYDPLGWLGPCTTYAKIIMQRVWQTEIGWDDEIPNNIKNQFLYFLKSLQSLNSVLIPRWLNLDEKDSPITLLGFADASESAYGCVIYLKSNVENVDNILLTSRSRVAPINFTTIARLELCAALLLAEVLEWTENLFKERIVSVHAFSDSKIVLSWLQSHPSKWKTFVANRTSEILRRYNYSHWHYINTKENPADLISRGLLPEEIVNNELWWKGPKTIELDLPFSIITENEAKIFQHEQKSKTCHHSQNSSNKLISYFSTNRKLLKRVSSITVFLINCLKKCIQSNPKRKDRFLYFIERFQNSEHVVLRLVQHEHFPKEIQLLKNKSSLPKNSRIRTLTPFIDGFGILRVGSRLEKSNVLSYDQKYPIILPSHHQFTTNLIYEAHNATLHGSFKLTFAYIRNKFHIIRAKDRINFYIRRCINCIRHAKDQQNQLMGSLPFPRVNQSKPFLFTGVDYAGPMLIRNKFSKGSKTSKAYISIFVCLCTKAIHIELVSDLTSAAFLSALRRFIARRGRCQTLFSDCGTNFKGASKILQNECHEAQKCWNNELQPQLSEFGISWQFNPPASPHFGGIWEAGVKSIKSHLNRTLKDAILTFEEYSTVLIQIEGILNSRPLCPISDNPNCYEFLTPSHFLIGESIVAPPEPVIKPKIVGSLKRWRYLQYLNQQFWQSWKETYLHTLSKRPKWLDLQRNFQVNDLVLLMEDNLAPTIWPVARIVEVKVGANECVRVVKVKTADGKTFTRPVAKLRFLPIATQDDLSCQKYSIEPEPKN